MYRTTVWQTEEGDHLQLSFAVLDDWWEMLYEATYPLGPFHTLDDELVRAHDDWRRYLRIRGHQEQLELG